MLDMCPFVLNIVPPEKVFKSINSMIRGTDLVNLGKWCYEMGSKLKSI